MGEAPCIEWAEPLYSIQGYELCSLISRVIIAGNSLSDDLVLSDVNKENKVSSTKLVMPVSCDLTGEVHCSQLYCQYC